MKKSVPRGGEFPRRSLSENIAGHETRHYFLFVSAFQAQAFNAQCAVHYSECKANGDPESTQ